MRSTGLAIAVLLSTCWSISPAEARWNLKRVFTRSTTTVTTKVTPTKVTSTTEPGHLVRLMAAKSTTFPFPKLGMVRIYRGTRAPHVTQASSTLRKLLAANPKHKLLRGDEHFLSLFEARKHASNTHPDAVSATRLEKIAMCKILGYGTHVIAYDLPKKVFERLPQGDPCLAEVVLKHSIPDEYAVAIVRRPR